MHVYVYIFEWLYYRNAPRTSVIFYTGRRILCSPPFVSYYVFICVYPFVLAMICAQSVAKRGAFGMIGRWYQNKYIRSVT